ncbi:DUF2268 domain-containing protein [Fredinandcohnia sp. 179-A 10B2 NHS]|uniref:DUF2268 domain-containing protein n=1 Tax=Fredinandcohnia sp. 179-A 10B2 NHS TaxID=3235176 RepID=UPI00399FE183
MGVVQTNQWLQELYTNPIELCKNVRSYFPRGTSAREIYAYLRSHGMYRPIEERKKSPLDSLPKDVWAVAKKEYNLLQKEWGGPSVPIFIFPADETNPKIKTEFNGKSGLAFNDKLFLFFSNYNSSGEIKAVLTHEYNHVCRLSKYKKTESKYNLLDTVILEGIAENAVKERFGEKNVAEWTKYYSEERIKEIVQRMIIPNKNIEVSDRKHHAILYGKGFYPKMAGYCAGYYLVKQYLNNNNLRTKDVIGMNSKEFLYE